VVGSARRTSTGPNVSWLADETIFGPLHYDPERFLRRIRELSYLNKEVAITFHDQTERSGAGDVPPSSAGIAEYVAHLNENKEPLHSKVIYFFVSDDEAQVEIALQYNKGISRKPFLVCQQHQHARGRHASIGLQNGSHARDQ
jgi:DNA gyrase subunit B